MTEVATDEEITGLTIAVSKSRDTGAITTLVKLVRENAALRALSQAGRVARSPTEFMDDFRTFGAAANEARPLPPPKAKRLIPSDPAELKAEAMRMFNSGYGMNEVQVELELTEAQANEFFHSK